MEYFPKGDLGTYALEYAPLPEDECREIASQILRGLVTMHQERFAHRDVKPQVCNPHSQFRLNKYLIFTPRMY